MDACCEAWNALVAMPGRITSIATMYWTDIGRLVLRSAVHHDECVSEIVQHHHVAPGQARARDFLWHLFQAFDTTTPAEQLIFQVTGAFLRTVGLRMRIRIPRR